MWHPEKEGTDLRDIASRSVIARVGGALVAAAVASAAVALTGAGGAVAATTTTTTTKAPTIATQYTPNQIGVGQSSGITYTITDPNASGTLYQVEFADTLPSETVVDTPASATNSGCGTAPTINATSGATSISASGITVKAGTPCTISVSIAGNTAGTGSDAYTLFEYTTSSASYAVPGPAPTANETAAALQVIGAPIVTVASPKNKAVYKYGQSVKTTYACSAASGDDPTQLTCTAFDELTSNALNSGGKLDTKTPGEHTIDYEAISGITGDTTDVFVSYKVLPDNVVKIVRSKTNTAGALALKLNVPGAGKLSVTEKAGKTTVASKSVKVKGANKKLGLFLRLTSGGSALLASEGGKLKVKVAIAYTPKGGKKATISETVKL